MAKLPDDASELTRELRHRELLGLEGGPDEPLSPGGLALMDALVDTHIAEWEAEQARRDAEDAWLWPPGTDRA